MRPPALQSLMLHSDFLVEVRRPGPRARQPRDSRGARREGPFAEIVPRDSAAERLGVRVESRPLSSGPNPDGALARIVTPAVLSLSSARSNPVGIGASGHACIRADARTHRHPVRHPGRRTDRRVSLRHLSDLCARHNGTAEKFEVEPHRYNVFAAFGRPVVTLSTHMDTVPPFFPSREDDEFIWGRGACDTKGIIASMLTAAERLLETGARDFGLLFVVGEERNSAGAYHAAQNPRGSKYIINGEPTENQLALGSKGALRYEVVAKGKMAHSAYPELGESAIFKLLDALEAIRRVELPVDPVLGPSTLNIGTIRGGRAPNVIPDDARAEIFIRLVCDSTARAKRWRSPWRAGPN